MQVKFHLSYATENGKERYSSETNHDTYRGAYNELMQHAHKKIIAKAWIHVLNSKGQELFVVTYEIADVYGREMIVPFSVYCGDHCHQYELYHSQRSFHEFLFENCK